MDESRARQLLAETEYAVVSMTDTEGLPYGIPVNMVFESPDHAYIHCAPEGKKLRGKRFFLQSAIPPFEIFMF